MCRAFKPGTSAFGRVTVAGRYASPMSDRPPPNPAKLLEQWMEWERGETTPGRVMANLKTGGLPELLSEMVVEGTDSDGAPVLD